MRKAKREGRTWKSTEPRPTFTNTAKGLFGFAASTTVATAYAWTWTRCPRDLRATTSKLAFEYYEIFALRLGCLRSLLRVPPAFSYSLLSNPNFEPTPDNISPLSASKPSSDAVRPLSSPSSSDNLVLYSSSNFLV